MKEEGKKGREEGKAGDFTTRAFPPPPSNDPINHHLSKRAPQIESCSRLITISPTSEKIKASVSGILGSWKGSFPFLFVGQYRVKFIPLLSTSNYASSSRESAILLRIFEIHRALCFFFDPDPQRGSIIEELNFAETGSKDDDSPVELFSKRSPKFRFDDF